MEVDVTTKSLYYPFRVMHKMGNITPLLFLVVALISLTGCSGKPSFNTPYQVVLLDNGQAYFGKVEKMGYAYVTLSDVFYIQTQATAEGKVASNVLIKRGNEWHGPDKMYLNTRHVVMIEPVGPLSKVAELIAEATKKK
jgi:hypothetical protein